MTEPEIEQTEESDPTGPEEAKHSKPSGIKKLFGAVLPSGKREGLFAKIILAIALVWAAVWATNGGYPFWPGLAGILTLPLLLLAMMADNIYKE